MGNIIAATRGDQTTTYAYDALGQLIRTNDPHENATWLYHYDRGGNMTSKVKYAYTTGTLGTALQTISYGYDATWKDKLTSYNGQSITYDSIGNPLNDGTWNYTWNNGRQLRCIHKGEYGSAGYDENTYDYNADGLRVKKTRMYYNAATGNIGYQATEYTLHGKNIVHLSDGGNSLHFWYDAQNRPAIVDFNGTKYAYILNLQGDVVGIKNASGTEVVRYTYDAWGKLLETTGELASSLGYLNPFRYRGYVYDEETGLYYLRSRYYSPEWNRFVNADILMGDSGINLEHNIFLYCKNSPIISHDRDGMFFGLLVGAFCGAIMGAIGAVVSGEDVLAGAVSGAVSGAIAGAGVDIAVATCGAGAPVAAAAIAFASGGIGGGLGSVTNDVMNGRDIDLEKAGRNAVIGAATNLICFGTNYALTDTSSFLRGQDVGWGKAIGNNMRELGWTTSPEILKAPGMAASSIVTNYVTSIGTGALGYAVGSSWEAGLSSAPEKNALIRKPKKHGNQFAEACIN